MKLSTLAYDVVKNVKYLDDFGFTYNAFIEGKYDGDPDYSNSINNAFAPINEAIHRLSDMDKVAFEVEAMPVIDGNIGDLTAIRKEKPIKKIKCVFAMDGSSYRALPFREKGMNQVFLLTPLARNEAAYVQFSRDIKPFSKDDIYYFTDGTEVTQNDVELSDYGISETACGYIIEYAQGKLQEQIAPELANMHLTRAEQYIADLETSQTAFYQASVDRKHRMM